MAPPLLVLGVSSFRGDSVWRKLRGILGVNLRVAWLDSGHISKVKAQLCGPAYLK